MQLTPTNEKTMSYGGHILDMIKRINANNSLKKVHREKKNKLKTSLTSKTIKDEFKNETISAEVLNEIKINIQKTLRKEQKKEVILTIVIFCCILLLLLFS